MELRTERAALIKASQDICDAENRIRKHQELARQLKLRGADTCAAERLIDVLQRTLLQWEIHRGLIKQHIHYLENGRTILDGFGGD